MRTHASKPWRSRSSKARSRSADYPPRRPRSTIAMLGDSCVEASPDQVLLWTAMKGGLPGGTLQRVYRRSELEEAHAHVARWIGSKSTSARCVPGQRRRLVGGAHRGAA